MSGPPADAAAAPLRLTLATKVTLLRFVGIPVFVSMMVYYRISLSGGAPQPGFRWAAFVVFLVVALTDALDGFLARSRGEISRLGALLDPLADKLLLWSAILTLTAPGQPGLQPQLPVWFALIAFSRDLLLAIGAGALHHHTGPVEIRPTLVGKAATALQMACVVAALGALPSRLVGGLAAVSAAGLVVSAVQYVRRGLRLLRAPPVLPPSRPAVTPPAREV
ncbi:MAG: CDP-alcohol phosphatidyltransferase family protein [Kiritimatiellae bacterium]|nr:CDP-alcohol phosphatidyltransferase family protein [Kiritimatiellia bacterium]